MKKLSNTEAELKKALLRKSIYSCPQENIIESSKIFDQGK